MPKYKLQPNCYSPHDAMNLTIGLSFQIFPLVISDLFLVHFSLSMRNVHHFVFIASRLCQYPFDIASFLLPSFLWCVHHLLLSIRSILFTLSCGLYCLDKNWFWTAWYCQMLQEIAFEFWFLCGNCFSFFLWCWFGLCLLVWWVKHFL